MAILLRNSITLLLLIIGINSSHAQKLGFAEIMERSPDRATTFCLPRNDKNIDAVENAGLELKYQSENWAFITATPRWIQESLNEGTITDFYFDLFD